MISSPLVASEAAQAAVAAPFGKHFAAAGRCAFAGDVRIVILTLLRVADLAVIVGSALASYWARHGDLDLPYFYWLQIVAAGFIATNGFEFGGLYDFASLRHTGKHIGRVAVIWSAAALGAVTFIYFIKMGEEVSRVWVAIWVLSSFAGLLAVRLVFWMEMARNGNLAFNVALIGSAEAARQMAGRLGSGSEGDVRIVGVFSPASEPSERDGLPGVDDLIGLARRIRIDEIVVAVSYSMEADLKEAVRRLGEIPTDVNLRPETAHLAPFVPESAEMPSVPLLRRPLAGWPIVIKRGMDLAISAALIALLAPLMLVIAIAVKVDSPGPVLFRQQRFGFNKNPITVFKFRTMRVEEAGDPSVPQARRNDPRVTRVGAFLRRTSLDELPQILNVLGGSMSLVGPRPHAIVHDEKYAELIDGYLARHRVKPGITGWAQVKGFRGPTETTDKMEKRLEHDLFYIEKWSPILDLRILFLTFFVPFKPTNAF